MVKAKELRPWKSAAARRLMKFAGESDSVERAVEKVVATLIKTVHSPPTDLDALREPLRIRGIVEEDTPFSGELKTDGDGFRIVYSKHLSSERRRFTIAHEMGHAIMESTSRGPPRSGKELERICDMLASEILMPKSHFLPLIKDPPSLQLIFDLAKTFKTSLSATAHRYYQLRKIPIFEVEKDFIAWAYGSIRKGPVASAHPALRERIEKITTGAHGAEVLPYEDSIWQGYWLLQGKRLGKSDRMLFLLRPLSAEEHQKQLSFQIKANRYYRQRKLLFYS